MLEAIFWLVTSVVGLFFVVQGSWLTIKDARAVKRKGATHLSDLVKDDLILHALLGLILFLTLGVSVLAVAIQPPRPTWVGNLITWSLIPIPLILGLIGYNSRESRKRQERNLRAAKK